MRSSLVSLQRHKRVTSAPFPVIGNADNPVRVLIKFSLHHFRVWLHKGRSNYHPSTLILTTVEQQPEQSQKEASNELYCARKNSRKPDRKLFE